MNNQKESNTDRLISRNQFRELTGISRTTEWRLSQEGVLPGAVVVNGRFLGYLESAYADWLKQHSV